MNAGMLMGFLCFAWPIANGNENKSQTINLTDAGDSDISRNVQQLENQVNASNIVLERQSFALSGRLHVDEQQLQSRDNVSNNHNDTSTKKGEQLQSFTQILKHKGKNSIAEIQNKNVSIRESPGQYSEVKMQKTNISSEPGQEKLEQFNNSSNATIGTRCFQFECRSRNREAVVINVPPLQFVFGTYNRRRNPCGRNRYNPYSNQCEQFPERRNPCGRNRYNPYSNQCEQYSEPHEQFYEPREQYSEPHQKFKDWTEKSPDAATKRTLDSYDTASKKNEISLDKSKKNDPGATGKASKDGASSNKDGASGNKDGASDNKDRASGKASYVGASEASKVNEEHLHFIFLFMSFCRQFLFY